MKSPNIEPLEARIAPAVISIAGPAPADEGSSVGTKTNFDFTVSLDAIEAGDVTVRATVMAGSASDADGDYVARENVLVTIPGGQSSAVFTVEVNQDRKHEQDETFKVVLSSPNGTSTLDAVAFEAEATILNDDPVPTIAIEAAKTEEGDAGTKLLTFTVRLSNATDQVVTFDWNTADGSAVSSGAVVDFVANSGTGVEIAAGQTFTTVSVEINGDTEDEGDENFSATISNPKLGGVTDPAFNIAPGGAEAVGTIENDDVTVRIANASVTEGDAGTQQMNFAVSLLQLTTRPVTVTLAVEDGTAVAGRDYTVPAVLELTIPAGSQSGVFSVPVTGDLVDEPNETFTVRIVDATNAKVGNAVATGTILDDDATPTLSVGGVTLAEGDAGAQEMTFVVTLSAASGQTVTVDAATMDGTAISAPSGGSLADFVAKSGPLVFLPERPDPGNPGFFLPAETTKEFKVSVNGDARFEFDETFSVQLSNAVGATIASGSATGTITNDDAQPTLEIVGVTLDEGSGAGTTEYVFTVQLSAVSGLPVTVTAATADGTALAGSDYTAKTQALTIPVGETSASFTVLVAKDGFFEADESFSVGLSGAMNAGITTGTAAGMILNDDPLPTLSVADLTVVEGDSGAREVEFVVTLSGVQNQDVTFDWQTAGGTADGADYGIVGVTPATIVAGETATTLRVTVNGDAVDESDEDFFVNLSNGMLAGNALTFTKAQATGKILNDDLTVGVKENITVNEGDSGETDAVFTIALSAPSAHPVTVTYSTQDGTAVSTGAAADFQAVTDTVTFAPGETEKPVTVKVNGDLNFDLPNAFQLVLSQPENAKLGVSAGTATIIEEPTDTRPAASISSVARAEDADGGATTTFEFHVTLDHASDETVVITAQTFADTALAGSDFTSKLQSLTFAPGETDKTFTVSVINDSVFEAEEQFRVVLSDPINSTIATSEAIGTIQVDGDLAPRLLVASRSITEGNSDQQTMTFVVQRIGATEVPVTFDFNTIGGTADAGVDFTGVSQSLTILPGESSVSVDLLVNGDTDDEPDETFTVELTNITGGRLAPASDGVATGTILNDDLTASFQQADFSVREGDSGQSDLVFTVELSAVSAHDVTVTYTLAPGTAAAGVDFQQPALLTLTIPAGNASGEIRVPVLGDTKGENDETLSLTLASATGAQIGTTIPTATGTILDDDAALSIGDARVVEGAVGTTDMIFVVSLANASVFPVTVQYTTVAPGGTGSATAGVDYGTVAGDLTFGPGETEKEIIVPVNGDTSVEGDERFLVRLSNPMANGAAIDALLDSEATGTIQDDDVFLSIGDVTLTEGDSGTRQAIFTINVTPSSAFPVSVIATTMDGTAVSVGGSPDFVAKTETITFTAGQTTKTFAVTVNGDLAFEPASEQFKVLLSGATGALIVDGEGIGTINGADDPPPSVSIADLTIVEGNAGTKEMQFVVSLSQPVGADVLVDVATAFGAGAGAADGADIVPVTMPGFVIPAGEKTAVFSVTVNGDTADEQDETFAVNLSNARTTLPGAAAATALTISDAQATGTILNDDLTVSIAPTASDTEGDTGTKSFAIGVQLSTVSAHAVTVTYNVTAGTAGATDFVAGQNRTLTIPAGQSGGEILVDVNGDLVDENDETFFVTLVGVANAQLGPVTASTVTILDNDPAPSVTISDPVVTEGGQAAFVVTLSAVSARDVTIEWVTESGTATGGDGSLNPATRGDFRQFTLPQTLVIPAGQTTGSIGVQTVNDPDDEVAETFGVRILESSENVTVAAGGVLGTATISANDLSALNISDVTVVEGNSGTVEMIFTVSRAGSGNKLPVTVNYVTSDGTATAASGDYVAANSMLTIPAGSSSGTISITINGDTLNELDETLFVTLSNPANATISDAVGIGTIKNDEVTYKLVPVAGQSLTVDEEGAGGAEQIVEFKVVRDGALDKTGSVFFATAADDTPGANSATSGVDFVAQNSSVSFSVGAAEGSQTVKVRIRPDTTPEGAETFKVRLSNPVNGVLSATESEQTITIDESDTDDLPRVIIEDASVLEGTGAGTTNLVFKVKLVGDDGTTPKATGGSVVIRYEALSGTAIAGEDFTAPAAGASVTIPAGQTEATISIPITRDSVDEADETFSLSLLDAELTVPGVASPFPVTLADASAEGTIRNDDLTLTLDPVPPVPEGNADNVRTFTFRIPQASLHDVSVTYTLKDGTAVSTGAFADYDASVPSGIVTIPAGQTEASFSVLIHGDQYAEANETFTIEFSGATGAILAQDTATVTLSNDDAAPSLTIGDATIVEGNAGQQNLVFTVSLAGGTQEDVTVSFATADGSARSSGPIVDYEATTGTLTFPASATGGTQQISVAIFGDTWRELDETFTVTLSGATVNIASAVATGTIIDDGDTVLGLTVAGARVVEGDSLGGTLNFVVTTTAPVTGSAVSFLANTRPGTAQAADFIAIADQSVAIGLGSSSTTVSVQVTGDTAFEPLEFMFLDLSDFSPGVTALGASAGTVSAQGVILNDDVGIVSARSFQYVDTDGDIVTVTLSKGSLNVPTGSSLSTGDVTFVRGGSPDVGGRFLQLLNLSNDGTEFARANIAVTSRVQVLPDGTVLGDGKANVGAIESSVPSPGLFQFTSGVALGKVQVSGDLGRIIAGDALRPSGVKSLNVGSFGAGTNLPASGIGLAADASVVLGPIRTMTVNGDFAGSLLVIGDALGAPIPTGPVGKIGKLVVKGNLVGDAGFGTGRILTTGGIGSATLGGIIGGNGNSSARIEAVSGFGIAIGSLTVLGDIVGGAGASSATIEVARIGKLNIGGLATKSSPAIEADIIGGSGTSSGRISSGTTIGKVTMNGSITGGDGNSSGQIFARATLGKTRITGDVAGGDGSESGALAAGAFAGNVTIEGDIRGGTGTDSGIAVTNGIASGFVVAPGDARSITIGKAGVAGNGSIIGGDGRGSGRVGIAGNLGKFTVFGDIAGGTNTDTGGISTDGRIGRGLIMGDLIGGGTDAAGGGGPATLLRSGFVIGSGISSIVVEGQIVTGRNLGNDLGGSAVIASSQEIGVITVKGAVTGNSTAAAVISAQNAIGRAIFGGNVEFAEILAGYSPVSDVTAPRGTLANLDALIGKVIVDGTLRATSIVAGVNAGGDGMFGTLDDQSAVDGAVQPPATRAISRIASVIAGAVDGHPDSPAGASYGIVAEEVKAVKVGGVAVPLNKGAHNDDATAVGGAAAKLNVLET